MTITGKITRSHKCAASRALALTITNAEAAPETEVSAEPINAFGVKVGDLFYASWGYDQTNLDFFQVVALRGKTSVLIREVKPELVKESAVSGMSRDVSYRPTTEMLPPTSYSVFIDDNEKGDLKRIGGTPDHCYLKFSHTNAYPYKGEKLYESWYA